MLEKPTKAEVLLFVEKFKFTGKTIVEELFTCGNCYYFAVILKERFQTGEIYYLPIENHFVWKYDGILFDIKGEHSTNERAYSWEEYKKIEPLGAKRIERDCIEFGTRSLPRKEEKK